MNAMLSRRLTGTMIVAACMMQLLILPKPALAQITPTRADSLSRDELVCALSPMCGTERALIRHRGLTVAEPDSPPPRTAPPFFTSITFEFNSATLTDDARETLDRIGAALRDPTLEHVIYHVEGHTDAKGTDAYNQVLSEQRANAVRSYLMEKFGISGDRLIALGLGKTQPLPNPPAESPFAAVNRRVQFSWAQP
jgi:outer membrane protein OmpA-like peptidoglycan-associated protein